MQTILIPTNFSEASDNALQYAKEFAGTLHNPVGLVLLHALDARETSGRIALPDAGPMRPHSDQGAVEKLRYYARSCSRQSGIRSCRTMAAQGKLSHVLGSGTRRVNADLVLMGSEGSSPARALHKATSSDLIDMVQAPVLMVPRQQVFMPLHNLVFAADLLHTGLQSLQNVLKLALNLHARLQVVHIYCNSGPKERLLVQHLWADAHRTIHTAQAHLFFLSADSIATSLPEFLREQHADLMVVCPKRHPALNSFLQKSKNLSATADGGLPLLVLPHTSLTAKPHQAHSSVFAHDQVDYIA